MKRKVFLGLMTGSLLFLTACTGQPATDESRMQNTEVTAQTESGEAAYRMISAEEAKKMMDEGEATVVDVRTAEEYAQEHIPGAVLVPNESIGDEAPEELPDKEAVLLVHCRTGVRSKQASEKLAELGYEHVFDFGGIADWPYETESGAAE